MSLFLTPQADKIGEGNVTVHRSPKKAFQVLTDNGKLITVNRYKRTE